MKQLDSMIQTVFLPAGLYYLNCQLWRTPSRHLQNGKEDQEREIGRRWCRGKHATISETRHTGTCGNSTRE